ncbi:hypothetical protein GW17_00061599 [Ensete ventricosum]|nr:hypothetical protein GW17_00061599 [Ensete ventricosum]
MSSRRSSITGKEINELASKLRSLLPESRRRNMSRVIDRDPKRPLSLLYVCLRLPYIKSLHREVDDLSSRLSDLMSTMEIESPQAEIIKSILGS